MVIPYVYYTLKKLIFMANKELISKIYKSIIQLNIKKFKWAVKLNICFHDENKQMANKHMKIFSKSLIIREIQIKIKMRNHLTPVYNRCHQKDHKLQVLARMWKKIEF